jgi:hypothetical protein
MRRSTVIVSFALIFVLAACSSGGSSPKASPATDSTPSTKPSKSTVPSTIVSKSQWDPAGVQRVRALGRDISRAYKGQCADNAFLPRDQYVEQANRLKFEIPLAVADCTAFGDTMELSAFPSDAVRDTWNQNRTKVLCERAKGVKYNLLGLHFAVAPNVSLQGTSEFTAKQLAKAVNGTYTAMPCPGVEFLDWEPAAEARVDQLAETLAKRPNLKCDDFELLDRDTYARNRQYVGRMPAAYARCNGPGGAVLWLAAFSPQSASRDKFVEGEIGLLCGSQQGVTAVRGADWALLTADPHVASIAAAALGGTAAAPSC